MRPFGLGKTPPPVRKIVVLRPGCCLEEARLGLLGGTLVRRLPLVNGLVVDFPPGADLRLTATIPEVVRIDDDLPLRLVAPRWRRLRRRAGPWPLPWRIPARWWEWLRARLPCRRAPQPPPPPQSLPWGVEYVRAPAAWQVARGEGVTVAVLDTGVDLRHPDLRGQVAGGYNALAPGRDPADDNGHGTHVAGIIAAADNDQGVVGVAPAARLYAVKVLDRWGAGFLSDLIHGLDWCVRNRVRVANLSLGSRSDNESFREAVRRAAAAGMLLVCAAGNEGPADDTVNYPARYPEVLAVAAIGRDGRLASFSSRGPQVGLAAPGVDVPSTWAGGGYRTLSGTSMATPHVSGTAALVLQTAPDLDGQALRRRLVGAARRLLTCPYPVLDAAAAVGAR